MRNGHADPASGREWEMLVPDPVPDPTLVIDPALPRDFRKLTSVDLQPVFDVEVSRETRHLTSDRARIDVSLDDGAIVAGEEREPICEIELELVAGELDDLFAEVQRISDAVNGRLHARTLTDLGYALKTADREPWSRAAKLNFTPGMTAHDAFRRHRVQRVLASDRERRLCAAQSPHRRRASVPGGPAAAAVGIQDLSPPAAPPAYRAGG